MDFFLEDPEEAGLADLLGRFGTFKDRSGSQAELTFRGGHRWGRRVLGGRREGRARGEAEERVEGWRGKEGREEGELRVLVFLSAFLLHFESTRPPLSLSFLVQRPC